MTHIFSVRQFPLTRKPLGEESEHWRDECCERGHDHEAQPPGPEPALVPFTQAVPEAGDNIEPETEAAEDGAEAGAQCPRAVNEAQKCGGLILVGVVINVRDAEGVKEGTSNARNKEANKHCNHSSRIPHSMVFTKVLI